MVYHIQRFRQQGYEKNPLTFIGCGFYGTLWISLWCPERESNSHGAWLPEILSLVCLPIPSSGRRKLFQKKNFLGTISTSINLFAVAANNGKPYKCQDSRTDRSGELNPLPVLSRQLNVTESAKKSRPTDMVVD
jgi:hypothetical protein